MEQKRTSLWIAIAFTLISVGVLSYLTLHHYNLMLGLAGEKGMCNIGAFDCDAVNTSAYSEFGGRAIALWGAALNAFLAFLLFAHLISRNERTARYGFYISVFAAVISIAMGVIATMKIGVICLFCSAVYVASLVTVGALASYLGGGRFSHLVSDVQALFKWGDGGAFSTLVWGVIIAGLPVLVVHSMIMDAYGQRLKWAIPEALSSWQSAPQQSFSDEGALTMGAAVDRAALTLVEFADFRCPHCRHAVPSLHSFVKSHPDARLVFMNFPLDGSCNPALEQPGSSCPLAKAVYCANKAGKGWEAHDYMFENQGKISGDNLAPFFTAVGLDAEEIKKCIESSQTHDAILAQAVKGKEAGVQGTPTIYANGRNLPEGFLIPVLDAVYKEVKK